MEPEKLVSLTHFAAGAMAGYLSGAIQGFLPVSLAILFAVAKGTELLSKEKKGIKWWFANGFPAFFLTFLVFWTIGYNLM